MNDQKKWYLVAVNVATPPPFYMNKYVLKLSPYEQKNC